MTSSAWQYRTNFAPRVKNKHTPDFTETTHRYLLQVYSIDMGFGHIHSTESTIRAFISKQVGTKIQTEKYTATQVIC